MNIKRFIPSPSLSPFIREYLIISSSAQATNTLIPDTNLVLSLRYQGEVHHRSDDTAECSLIPNSVISGIRRTPRVVEYGADSANILVIFREGGLSALSRTPVHSLFGQMVASEELFGQQAVTETLDRLSAAKAKGKDDLEKIAITERLLTQAHKLNPAGKDAMISAAVESIRQNEGIIKMRDLSASFHISQDAFEKRFRAAVGTSPKQYASIVRLRQLIEKYPSYTSLTDAGYEAGYFDQSHFIKDFRTFTGQTPKAFFQSARYW
jgi:AraC-like DNA-binding protein